MNLVHRHDHARRSTFRGDPFAMPEHATIRLFARTNRTGQAAVIRTIFRVPERQAQRDPASQNVQLLRRTGRGVGRHEIVGHARRVVFVVPELQNRVKNITHRCSSILQKNRPRKKLSQRSGHSSMCILPTKEAQKTKSCPQATKSIRLEAPFSVNFHSEYSQRTDHDRTEARKPRIKNDRCNRPRRPPVHNRRPAAYCCRETPFAGLGGRDARGMKAIHYWDRTIIVKFFSRSFDRILLAPLTSRAVLFHGKRLP